MTVKKREFVVITGMSGAGKSEAIKSFEDMGYFCIDNLPSPLLAQLTEMLSLPGSKISQVALVSDIRGGENFEELFLALKQLKEKEIPYKIVFLEANDEELLRRFKETRRKHPLADKSRVIEGIQEERRLLEDLKAAADIIINTSNFQAYELKDKIRTEFLRKSKRKGLLISIISFGFKYGVPIDADLVIDVRFLPNPHYIKELRPLTGQKKKIRDFVLGRKETKQFIDKFHPLVYFLLPHYFAEGKTHLTIAIGCTGGAHRSVVLSEETAKFLKKKNYDVVIRHRDIAKHISKHEA